MNKGLIELLDHLMESYIDEENYDYDAYIKLAKALKALEIIKNKQVNIERILHCDTYSQYNYPIPKEERHLDINEFNLIKEWLENDN